MIWWGAESRVRHKRKEIKYMKKLGLLVVSLAVSINGAIASGHEEAIRTAIEGPEGAHAIVLKHRFAVRPAEIQEKDKSKYVLTGQLTRLDASPAKDDVIAYRIVHKKGAVESIDLQINGGM